MDLIHPEIVGKDAKLVNRCGNCQHFERLTGECRANPPQLVPMQQGLAGVWPPTRAEKWCGAHKAALNS